MAYQRLKDATEKAKIDLSGQKEAHILLPYILIAAFRPLNIKKTLTQVNSKVYKRLIRKDN